MQSDDGGDQDGLVAALDDILEPAGPDFELEKVPPKKMQQTTLASAFTKQVDNKILDLKDKGAFAVTTGDEESEGLEFIDPAAEKRAKLAEAAKEREEKPATILINGQLMSAHSIPG